jgi:hypothetical protein
MSGSAAPSPGGDGHNITDAHRHLPPGGVISAPDPDLHIKGGQRIPLLRIGEAGQVGSDPFAPADHIRQPILVGLPARLLRLKRRPLRLQFALLGGQRRQFAQKGSRRLIIAEGDHRPCRAASLPLQHGQASVEGGEVHRR